MISNSESIGNMGSYSPPPPTRLQRGNSRGFDTMTPLGPDFVPSDSDVLVGRGKRCLSHIGNLRFKSIVHDNLDAYLAAECRVDKTAILMEVISHVRSTCKNGGGFVKQNPHTGHWYEVGDFLAKEKTAQAFRDALHEFYSSSNPSKKKKRIQSSNSGNTMKNAHQVRKSNQQSLTNAIKQHQVAKRSSSAPSSPTYSPLEAYSMPPAPSTPPPRFARFVSLEDGATMSQPVTSAEKRKSSVIFGEAALAFLSSALGPVDDSFVDEPKDLVEQDPFAPIPLDCVVDDVKPEFRASI